MLEAIPTSGEQRLVIFERNRGAVVRRLELE